MCGGWKGNFSWLSWHFDFLAGLFSFFHLLIISGLHCTHTYSGGLVSRTGGLVLVFFLTWRSPPGKKGEKYIYIEF